MKRSFRVIKPYQSPFSDPLVARKGERLSFERRQSEWEGWIWCTCAAGRSGWVPESWVEIKDGYCVLQRDYSAAELSVGIGETITAEIRAHTSGYIFPVIFGHQKCIPPK